MEVFRDHGFAGTSAEALVERIGVSRYSLYADFGSMQGLFEAALERYNDDIIELRFGPLERPGAGLADIRNLIDFYGAAVAGAAAGRGCLLCNTAIEFGASDPTGRGVIDRYFRRLSGAFENALANAQKQGELRESVDTRNEASFLTSVILGLFVLIRADANPEIIERAAKAANDQIAAITV